MSRYIIFQNVKFCYDNFYLSLNHSISKNRFVALIGRSGSGKTTYMNLLSGFLSPKEGKILINDENMNSIGPSKRNISVMFQKNNLFNHLNVLENIILGVNLNLKLNESIKKKLYPLLDTLEISHLLKKFPRELSNGEEQRAAIARCLLQDNPILLMDEPFANLDPIIRKILYKTVYEISKKYCITTIIVSHFPNEIKLYAEEIIFLDKGKIIFNGQSDLFFNSKNKAIQQFIL